MPPRVRAVGTVGACVIQVVVPLGAVERPTFLAGRAEKILAFPFLFDSCRKGPKLHVHLIAPPLQAIRKIETTHVVVIVYGL